MSGCAPDLPLILPGWTWQRPWCNTNKSWPRIQPAICKWGALRVLSELMSRLLDIDAFFVGRGHSSRRLSTHDTPHSGQSSHQISALSCTTRWTGRTVDDSAEARHVVSDRFWQENFPRDYSSCTATVFEEIRHSCGNVGWAVVTMLLAPS